VSEDDAHREYRATSGIQQRVDHRQKKDTESSLTLPACLFWFSMNLSSSHFVVVPPSGAKHTFYVTVYFK